MKSKMVGSAPSESAWDLIAAPNDDALSVIKESGPCDECMSSSRIHKGKSKSPPTS